MSRLEKLISPLKTIVKSTIIHNYNAIYRLSLFTHYLNMYIILIIDVYIVSNTVICNVFMMTQL